MPQAPGRTALVLHDPGDGSVIISTLIEADELVGIEFEYLFDLPGRLDIILGGQTLESLYSDGSPAFLLFSEQFALDDVGLSPGLHLLELKLSNPDAIDPLAYIDEITVTTQVPEPSVMVPIVGGGVAFLRRRR